HRAREPDRRDGTDRCAGLRNLFQPSAARPHPRGDRRRHRDAGARARAGRAHPRSARHDRSGRGRPRRAWSGMNLAAHLPILPVVVPLVSAPIAVLSRRGAVAFVLATAASWGALALAAALWLQVQRDGVISYAIGNWPPPWGIEYRIDSLSAFVLRSEERRVGKRGGGGRRRKITTQKGKLGGTGGSIAYG